MKRFKMLVGFSVGIYEGWRQGVEEVVENTLTIRNDNYQSVITIVKQQGAGHMDIERLRKEMEEGTGFTTSTGKAACGEYMTVEIPKQIITEEHVKSMLESGQITQDLIDQNGGMESILATLNAQSAPSKQVYIPISNTSMIVVTTTLKEDEKEVIQQVFDFTVGSIVIE